MRPSVKQELNRTRIRIVVGFLYFAICIILFVELSGEPAIITAQNNSSSREAAASNSANSAEILAEFAKDSSKHVRAIVAKHQNTSAETLILLSEDEVLKVRLAAVRNPNVPLEIRLKFLEDSELSDQGGGCL